MWLEGLDEDVGREIESLCDLMADRVTDAVLSLAMFEQVSNRPPRALDKGAWERDRAAERFRQSRSRREKRPSLALESRNGQKRDPTVGMRRLSRRRF